MAARQMTSKAGTKFLYIKDIADAEAAARELMETRSSGYDVETTGLDPHSDAITLASFSTGKKTWVVNTQDINNLKPFIPYFASESHNKIAHNAIFEYVMTKGNLGVDMESPLCLMLAEQCLETGRQLSGFGLADITKKYLGKERDKTLQKSFIGHRGDFSDDQLGYSADDTVDLIAIGQIQQKRMIEDKVMKTWLIESAAVPAFGDMEFYGQRIDPEQWKALMAHNLDLAEKAKADLDMWFEPVVDRDLFGVMQINYKSTPQILQALRMLNVKVDGKLIERTDKKTQKKIKDLGPIKALMRYRSAVKQYGTYGQSYLDAINPKTGRVHFRFNQYGTGTGRPACRNKLNCLNIPRDERFRHAFGTDDGRLISTVDYSGAELRIMAELSGDRLMIDGFNSGEDFHCFVASMCFGVTVTKKNENSRLRTPAKGINFGLAYGLGPGSLCEQLNGEGFPITLDETKDLYAKYMKTFDTTIDWLHTQKKMASSNFMMANINGRRRYWFPPNMEKIRAQALIDLKAEKGSAKFEPRELKEKIADLRKGHLAAVEREGANFGIQSCNADMTKTAMAVMRKEFKRLKYDARMYNSVYDEIVLDTPKSCGQEVHEIQKKIMIDSAHIWLKNVRMDVDGHLLPYWSK